MSQHGGGPDGLNMMHEAQIDQVIREIRRIASLDSAVQLSLDQQIQMARSAIETFDATGFTRSNNRVVERTYVVAALQRIAYHDAEGEREADIAEWCMNQWLLLLQRNTDDLDALRGEKVVLHLESHILTQTRTGTSLAGSISERASTNSPCRGQFLQRKQRPSPKPERPSRVLVVGRSQRCGASKR
jgi:hypothetical protein